MSINLWGDNGPARERMDALAGWLRQERPDLVLMQEVEEVDGRGQAELLADAAGYPHVDAVRTGRLAGEGLAVLSRHALEPLSLVRLPLAPCDHRRGLQLLDVATPAGTLRVGNTHLAWRLGAESARAKQTRAVARSLPSPPLPVVLGGDLNDVPASAPLRVLGEAGFIDCCAVPEPAITFDKDNPFLWQPELAGRRVDHVLVRGLDMVAARVVLDGVEGPIVSDHFGVLATVRRRSEPAAPPG